MEEVRSQSSDCLLPGLPDDVALNCLARASISDHDSLSNVNKIFRKLIRSGDLHELRKKLGIVEDWVCFHSLRCDPNRWAAFNPTRNKWMVLPKIRSGITYKHTLVVDSELLVFGNDVHDRIVIWKYSWIRRGWVKCEGMNHPRLSFGSGSLGSTAVIAGGVDENQNVLKSAELYDSATGKWETLPNMNSARRLCSGCFVDGRFYVIGGMSSHNAMLTCGEEYDFETKKWRTIEGMNPYVDGCLWNPPIVAVVGNQLYSRERRHSMVRKYNKANNSWDVLGGLPVGVDIRFSLALDFLACGGELLVVNEQRGLEGIVLYSCCPKSNGTLDWKVLGTKKHVSVFRKDCAVRIC